MEKSAYDYLFLMRFALPDSQADGDAWRTNLPMVVLRVRDRNRSRAPEPYPAPVLDTRVAVEETSLTQDLNNLATALKNHWNQPAATKMDTFDLQTAFDMVGPDCDVRGMNCQADTQDTKFYLFYLTRDRQSLGLSDCFSLGPDKIPPGKLFKTAQRTYIKPGTARGPDSTKLAMPQLFRFDGSKMK